MNIQELQDRLSDALFDKRMAVFEAEGLRDHFDPWKVRILCNEDAQLIATHPDIIYDILKEYHATQETQAEEQA
jgi:hypothetical protein